MRKCVLELFLAAIFAGISLPAVDAGVVVDVDFEFLTAGNTISDGDKIQDVSGNGYHGFWGDAAGSYDIVETFNGGVGVDTASSAERGHVFLRDGLAGIPESWDGPTTTVSPYFTLEAAKNYTFEALVQFGSTTPASAGRDGIMGTIGATEFWMRADNGSLQYIFDDGPNYRFGEEGTNIDISSAYDGEFHNIAIVFDRTGGEVRSYLDGSLIHTKTDTAVTNIGEILDGTVDFRLGAYNTTDSDAFTGIQDRYRISDTALGSGDFLAIPEPATIGIFLLMGTIAILRKRLSK